MLGAFKPSLITQIGQVRYARRPWFLSRGQKARVRKRLRQVDEVIQTLKESNVPCYGLDEALKMKTEKQLAPKEKYYVFSRDPKSHMKPLTNVPHFTKMAHPRGFPDFSIPASSSSKSK